MRLLRRSIAALALAAVTPLGTGFAAAPEPRASLTDIEDEVMCPICGTLLELSEAPQAQRQRAFIRERIAGGDSKEQIKEALVAEYGQEVLALPDDSGFQLSAYLVPILAFIAGATALALGALRWRRAAGPASASPTRAPPADEDSERLDADLARYDL
jgi:cytochrome c-type biogenesis protein CcmH/NrfF